jgi:hypothetical protein
MVDIGSSDFSQCVDWPWTPESFRAGPSPASRQNFKRHNLVVAPAAQRPYRKNSHGELDKICAVRKIASIAIFIASIAAKAQTPRFEAVSIEPTEDSSFRLSSGPGTKTPGLAHSRRAEPRRGSGRRFASRQRLGREPHVAGKTEFILALLARYGFAGEGLESMRGANVKVCSCLSAGPS